MKIKRSVLQSIVHNIEDLECAMDILIDNIEDIPEAPARSIEDMVANLAGELQEIEDALQIMRSEISAHCDGLFDD